ncbi:MAG: hypothetical protein ABW172_10350, partial [Candidatus Binatia bacterium]
MKAIAILFLAGAFVATNPELTLSQSTGGTQSERSGSDDQTPMPKGKSSGEKGSTGKSQSKTKEDTSVGGSQSERSGAGNQTPLPQG